MPLSLDENFNLGQLLEEIAKIQNHATPKRMDLQQRVFCAYREKTLYDLSLILKGDIFDSQIELAELLTDASSQSQIAFVTDSPENWSRTLKTKLFNLQIRALKSFLADNWEMVNGTSLCYTAHPTSDLTFILCAVAKFVWANKAVWLGEGESWCVLKLLMPTVAIDSLDGTGTYPPLNEVDDVLEVLKTHILGREGKYLIPVKKLNELEGISTKGWVNPYYDYKNHSEEMIGLSAEEYQRMIKHSDYTEALFNAHSQYEISLNEQGSLLTHLLQLSRLLYFNSKHGTGNEANAGEGAYDAIIHFNDYFSKLDEASKGQIPAPVMVQINILLALASNAAQNIEGDICIANRRIKLEEAMHPVEHILMGIGLSNEDKVHLVHTKKQQLVNCQTAFAKAVTQQDYCGQDKLDLTLPLIEALQVKFTISSSADLEEIMKLSPNAISNLCQPKAIQQQLIDQFEKLEALVVWIHELSPAKLRAIMPLVGAGLAKKFLHDAGDLPALLILMDKERCQIIVEAVQNCLPHLIKNSVDFNAALEPLTPEQRAIVYEKMKARLPLFINSAYDFHLVLQWLSPEQRIDVLATIKERLPQITNNINDFKDILRWLSPRKYQAICLTVREKLPQIVRDTYDFTSLFSPLSLEQRVAVCVAMKDNLQQIISTANDLRAIFWWPSFELRIAVCESMQGKLSQIMPLKDLLPYFTNDFERRKVKQVFFYSLLQEARTKAFKFNNDKGGLKAKAAVDILYMALEDAAQIYFNIETPTQADYKDFHNCCTKAIERTYHDLKPYYGWKDFFAKLSITKVNLEITHSGGRGWEFRLFKIPGKKKLDEISELVKEIGYATPIL